MTSLFPIKKSSNREAKMDGASGARDSVLFDFEAKTHLIQSLKKHTVRFGLLFKKI